ncbi:MAG: UDP-galactopyranose mutase [Chloroflexota bacterium]
MKKKSDSLDLVCFSHLRWRFVFQRPQHLLARAARTRRVLYIEEPQIDEGPARIETYRDDSGVLIAAPYLPKSLSSEAGRAEHIRLIDDLLAGQAIDGRSGADFIAWYYTPMAYDFTRHLRPRLRVYDVMDDLSSFASPPPKLQALESELLQQADLVFTGGRSLYEARRALRPDVHLFPSSIDADHFAAARTAASEPPDQASIPHPRLGFFGVIDERIDLGLLARLAEENPDWQIVMIGPLAKVSPRRLPRRPNLHYLGKKDYRDLPAYLAGWDVALMPFALNQATRYISPTKTLEYLAGGKPVVSTPVADVVTPYGEQGLVLIGDGAPEFTRQVRAALELNGQQAAWLQAVDRYLAQVSWDVTWDQMDRLIERALPAPSAANRSAGRLASAGPVLSAAAQPGQAERRPAAAAVTASGVTSSGMTSSGVTAGGVTSGSSAAGSTTGGVTTGGVTTGGPASAWDTPPVEVGLPLNTAPLYAGNGDVRVFDYLVVGAGFAGSVLAERLARGSGKSILLIDRRSHIAGNAYDHYNDDGILVHKYGPHIFHTNSRDVFTYLSQFTRWRPYEHRVRANVDGQLVPMPINLDTINQLYGTQLSSLELQSFFDSLAEPVEQVLTSEDVVVSKVGRQLYEKFFRGYTRKQWGMDPSELDATVTSRVPVRLNRDDRYFTDVYQSMPLHGYTRLFENLLDHPNIKIMLNTDYRDVQNMVPYRELIFTGPVDEYFDYCYGKLPYRSLDFRFETLDLPQAQPVAVINHPNAHAYTRVTEFKHLTGQQHARTTLVYEYPCSSGDPYYPVPTPANADLYKRYKALADAAEGVHFVGRLATYRYYNMDQVTAQALTLYAHLAGINRGEAGLAYTRQSFSVDLPCSLLGSEETE